MGIFAVNGYFTNGLTNLPEPGAPMITMPANSNAEYDPIAAGYTDLKRYFYVVNTGITDAAVEVDILVEN